MFFKKAYSKNIILLRASMNEHEKGDNMNKKSILAISLLATLSLTGCFNRNNSSSASGAEDAKTYTFREFLTVSPSNWNELTYQDANDTEIMDHSVGIGTSREIAKIKDVLDPDAVPQSLFDQRPVTVDDGRGPGTYYSESQQRDIDHFSVLRSYPAPGERSPGGFRLHIINYNSKYI